MSALLFCSGAAALAYEVLWVRDWSLVYGSTAAGTAVVLVAYFAGLAIGAAVGPLFGRRTDDLRRFAWLEAAVAASVGGYLVVRPRLAPAAVALARAASGPALPLMRAAFVLLVLGVPTTLIGATLPVAVASGITDDVARLYAWNTLGGAAGALACGLVGIRVLGMRGTYLAAMLLDLGVAALASRRRSLSPRDAAPLAHGRRAWRGALVAAALAGAIGLAAEVLWSRGLSGVLSDSVYSVSFVLAATLLGLTLGTAIGRRFSHRAAALPATFGVLALGLLASLGVLHALPAVSSALIRTSGPPNAVHGLAIEAVLATTVVLTGALALGAAFPLVLARLGMTSRATGNALAANTAGGILGALAGAFVLLPRLGLAGGLVFLAALALAGAALAASTRHARMLAGLGAAAVAASAAVAPPLLLPWRQPPSERVLRYRDGPTATVMVTADARGGKRLRVNGQYSLGGTTGVLLEAREAHLPLLLHPAPRRLLHLGVGTGDTLGAGLAHPGVRALGVELLAEALDATALFATSNRGLLDDPRAHLVADDARSVLLASSDRFDVIVSDLYLPWTAGAGALYSLDHYRLARARLAPGGLYCQWLPLHQLRADDLAAIVATMAAAFPHVQLWLAYHRTATPLAAVIAGDQPLRTEASVIRHRLAEPALSGSLATAAIGDVADLSVLYVAGDDRLRAPASGTIITDDRPAIEFTAPVGYFRQERLAPAALAWIADRLDDGDGPIAGAPAAGRLRRSLLDAQRALVARDGPGELRAYLEALRVAPHVPAVRGALAAIEASRRAAGDAATAAVIADALLAYGSDR